MPSIRPIANSIADSRGKIAPFAFGYTGLSWPHYMVWDDPQSDFLQRAGQTRDRISVVGGVDFIDRGELQTPTLIGRTVAVFDVVPYKIEVLASKGLVFPYNRGDIVARFLMDLSRVTAKLGMTMAFKAKRQLNEAAAPEYNAAVEAMSTQPHIVLIHPDIAARRLVRDCAAAVSLPFTSAALMAREEQVPSLYYDPMNRFVTGDRLAHGIAVCSSDSELERWLKEHATISTPAGETVNRIEATLS